MQTYISFGKWTGAGLAALGTDASFDTTRAGMNELGIQVEAFFWMPGGHPADTMVISKAESVSDLARARQWTARRATVNTDVMHVAPIFDEPLNDDEPIYLSLGRWTEAGLRSPSQRLMRERERLLTIGVSMRSAFSVVTGSRYDTVVISQSASVAAIRAAKLATAAMGFSRTELCEIVPEAQFMKAKQESRRLLA